MAKIIDSNKFYNIHDDLFVCCDEHQFRHYCKAHTERMGCMFCSFNPDTQCPCD